MSQPFVITRWDAPKEPDEALLTRLLAREGWTAKPSELAAGMHSPEIKFDKTIVRAVVRGRVQYAFPGYGVIELGPGDVLEIEAHTLHDVTVLGHQEAIVLMASR